MRVILLGQYPLMNTPSFGGAEVALVNLQRHLRHMPDLELHIVTCRPEIGQPQFVEQEGVAITYLPRQRFGRATWHYREIAAILPVLRRLSPDIVHAHMSGFYAGAALASGYPTVITVHGILSQEARLVQDWRGRVRGWLDAQYEQSVIRRSRHMLVITPYVQRVFGGLFAGQSYWVENPCDERFFAAQRRPVAGRILFSGYVCARKGVLPLLKALWHLRRNLSEAHLYLAGHTTIEQDYYRACADYVREAGLQHVVTFLGQIDQEQMVEQYASCATLVLPSFQETAPIAIEEAMAVGAPVLATRVGGIPWMVEDGVTGITLPVPLAPEGDPMALSQALAALLSDPVRAERMGQAGKAEAEKRFHAEMIARRTRQVYEQVIRASRGKPR